MRRYQSFFLCGNRWNEPNGFVHFINWILTVLEPEITRSLEGGPKCFVGATKPADFGKRKPSFSGDYFKQFKRLENEKLESAVVVAGVELQIYVRVEFLHMKMISEPNSAEPEQQIVEVPDGIKIVSISLRNDMWQKCKELGIADGLIYGWEQLYITSGALYGYATPTELPKTSKFNQIGQDLGPVYPYDSEGRSTLRPGDKIPIYPRVMDFDYTSFVEGVGLINYISNVQLEKSGSRARILAASGDVRSRVLRDADDKEVGVAVELANDSDATKRYCAEIFGNLLWKPTEFHTMTESEFPKSVP